MGALLAAAGVLPWILFALGLRAIYEPIFPAIGFRSLFHPLVEAQAALGCFAAGYLMTALGKARPASAWQVAAAAGSPLAVAVFAAMDRWALAQAAFLAG